MNTTNTRKSSSKAGKDAIFSNITRSNMTTYYNDTSSTTTQTVKSGGGFSLNLGGARAALGSKLMGNKGSTSAATTPSPDDTDYDDCPECADDYMDSSDNDDYMSSNDNADLDFQNEQDFLNEN